MASEYSSLVQNLGVDGLSAVLDVIAEWSQGGAVDRIALGDIQSDLRKRSKVAPNRVTLLVQCFRSAGVFEYDEENRAILITDALPWDLDRSVARRETMIRLLQAAGILEAEEEEEQSAPSPSSPPVYSPPADDVLSPTYASFQSNVETVEPQGIFTNSDPVSDVPHELVATEGEQAPDNSLEAYERALSGVTAPLRETPVEKDEAAEMPPLPARESSPPAVSLSAGEETASPPSGQGVKPPLPSTDEPAPSDTSPTPPASSFSSFGGRRDNRRVVVPSVPALSAEELARSAGLVQESAETPKQVTPPDTLLPTKSAEPPQTEVASPSVSRNRRPGYNPPSPPPPPKASPSVSERDDPTSNVVPDSVEESPSLDAPPERPRWSRQPAPPNPVPSVGGSRTTRLRPGAQPPQTVPPSGGGEAGRPVRRPGAEAPPSGGTPAWAARRGGAPFGHTPAASTEGQGAMSEELLRLLIEKQKPTRVDLNLDVKMLRALADEINRYLRGLEQAQLAEDPNLRVELQSLLDQIAQRTQQEDDSQNA